MPENTGDPHSGRTRQAEPERGPIRLRRRHAGQTLLILREFTILSRKDLTLESTPECILSMDATKVVTPAAKIGQVAKETGLSIDAIRFYEKEGLLKRSPRTEGGFRIFSSVEIQALKFIHKAQELGFSLSEIRELLILRSEHVPACSHVKELLQQKVASVG